MAISKNFTFNESLQLTSKLGHAIGHPARVVIMSRLVTRGAFCYTDLVAGIDLTRATIHQHLHLLKKLGFIQPVILESNLAGFQLNRELYFRCVQASRREFRQVTQVIALEDERGVGEIG